MTIKDLLNQDSAQISCEIFPPKEFKQIGEIKAIAGAIAALPPSFISVTYGAAGNTPQFTREISQAVQARGVPALAHLTCINDTRSGIAGVLDALESADVRNVLALRGDLTEGCPFPDSDRFLHARDLIAAIRRRNGFCVGAACYPEGHPEAPGRDTDMDYLRAKVDAGADFLITQMFFDNNILYNFLYRALKKGIHIPVCAGIMPVVNARQIKRIIALSGAGLPPRFAAIVDRFGDDPASMREAGIAYATEQIIDLVANGVNRIHLYTMNKTDTAAAIFSNLRAIISA